MPLVLSSVALVGLLAIVAVLGFMVVARVPLTRRNRMIVFVGIAVIVGVVVFSH